MYLSPPSVHCVGPIKMELPKPETNLPAALQVLELHHSKLDTTKVKKPFGICGVNICTTWGSRIKDIGIGVCSVPKRIWLK